MRNAILSAGLLALLLSASAFVLVGGKPVAKPEQPVAIEPVLNRRAARPWDGDGDLRWRLSLLGAPRRSFSG